MWTGKGDNGGKVMDTNVRKIYTEQEIMELDMNELDEMAGGTVVQNDVKCPICGKYYPIRTIKDHLKLAHKK